jgi:hypothetical protein
MQKASNKRILDVYTYVAGAPAAWDDVAGESKDMSKLIAALAECYAKDVPHVLQSCHGSHARSHLLCAAEEDVSVRTMYVSGRCISVCVRVHERACTHVGANIRELLGLQIRVGIRWIALGVERSRTQAAR